MRLGRHLLVLGVLGALPSAPAIAEATAPRAANPSSGVYAPSRSGGIKRAGNARSVPSPKGRDMQPPGTGADGVGGPRNLPRGRETPPPALGGAIKNAPAGAPFKGMARTPSPASAPKLGVGTPAQISGTGMRVKGSGPARIGPAGKSGGHISGNDIIHRP
jgi:hypothetical protein